MRRRVVIGGPTGGLLTDFLIELPPPRRPNIQLGSSLGIGEVCQNQNNLSGTLTYKPSQALEPAIPCRPDFPPSRQPQGRSCASPGAGSAGRSREVSRCIHYPSCARASPTNMAHAAIAIHEDEDALLQESCCLQSSPKAKDMERHRSEDEASVDGSISDDSDESEDEVDESVIEDMRKLEESFKGISQKYRLINRIGEGTPTVCPLGSCFRSPSQARSRPYTKRNNSPRMMMPAKRMTSPWTVPNLSCPLPRSGKPMQSLGCRQDHGGSRKSLH